MKRRKKPDAPDLDPALLRKLLLRMYEDIDELDFVIGDLMAPRHKRIWGYVTHAEKHGEARESLLHSLTYALRMLGVMPPPPEEPPPDDGPGSDPAGSGAGGAGPVH